MVLRLWKRTHTENLQTLLDHVERPIRVSCPGSAHGTVAATSSPPAPVRSANAVLYLRNVPDRVVRERQHFTCEKKALEKAGKPCGRVPAEIRSPGSDSPRSFPWCQHNKPCGERRKSKRPETLLETQQEEGNGDS